MKTYEAGSREELAHAVEIVWGKLNIAGRHGSIADVLTDLGWFALAKSIKKHGDPSAKRRRRPR